MCVCLYVVKEETLGRNRKILDSLLFCSICPHCWCCCCLVAQSCRTLCDPMDCSPPGSSVHGISQARMLEWVAMPCSRASSPPRDRTWISCVLCIGSWILYHWVTWEALCVSGHRLTAWKRPWCWERLKAGGEGDDRGWDGWMASPTQWTWVWASSRSWWWTGKPGVLQSMGSQRVGHDWPAELNGKIILRV